jgi:outer membrane protein OmpA-like peptidoglycan-associated protein
MLTMNRRSSSTVFVLLGLVWTGLWAAVPEGVSQASGTAVLDECRALFESGQHNSALGKCMAVLRQDPHHEEARYYVRQLVDIIKAKPGSAAASGGASGISGASSLTQEESAARLRKRMLLAMDLRALPGIKVLGDGGQSRVEINTSWLFPDKSGGLKDSGVPLLDRVSSWLKTYGNQPIIIHSYPEELSQTPEDGSLFIQRYSELYNFFVEEKRFDPIRFVSVDLLSRAEGAKKAPVKKARNKRTVRAKDSNEPKTPIPTGSVIVIETVGSASLVPGRGADVTLPALSWIEFAVIPSKTEFSPEKGEWTNLDVAAVSKKPAKSWNFTITKEKGTQPVLAKSGTGNILERISWNGIDEKSGSLVPTGVYVAQLTAMSDSNLEKKTEIKITVRREGQALVASTPDSPAPAKKKGKKKKKVATPVSASASETPAAAPTTPAAATAPADDLLTTEVTSEAEPSDASGATIWKQVIQFDRDAAAIKPTLKTSLERIAKTLEVYPLQKVRIVGFASADEAGGLALAKKRAEAIRNSLVKDYNVDATRVVGAGGKISDGPDAQKAELSITN